MEFEKQSEIMEMKEEMMNDAIDDAMGEDDDEENSEEDGEEGIQVVRLSKHPKEIVATTKLDLSEISSLTVNHEIKWIHKKPNRGAKIKFVEIVVLYKDTKKTEKH